MQIKKTLGLFPLMMMAIAAIFSLRSLPIVAVYGFGIIALYCIAAILFFIPSAYVCNELTQNVKRVGGLYAWVEKAFGKKVGLIANDCYVITFQPFHYYCLALTIMHRTLTVF